jgi:hypothetical protein
MHFRNLRSKAKLVQETEKVSKQLEVKIFILKITYQKTSSSYLAN